MPLLYIIAVCFLCFSQVKAQTTLYTLPSNGASVPRATIEAYLSKGLTMQSILDQPCVYNPPYNGQPNCGPYRPDNPGLLLDIPNVKNALDMISKVKPKYIHRADGIWALDWMFAPGIGHLANLQTIVPAVHAIDPDIILEAGLFEAVQSGSQNPIMTLTRAQHPHVFEAFSTQLGSLNSFEVRPYDMLYTEVQNIITSTPGALPADYWYIPDMSKWQTRVWFYYRACEYIKLGFESLHMGRMDLMLKRDCNNVLVGDLLDKIRAYARLNARRKTVFINSSSDGTGVVSCSPPPNSADRQLVIDRPDIYFHKPQVWYRGTPSDKRLLWDWGSSGICMVETPVPAPGTTFTNPPTSVVQSTLAATRLKLRDVVILEKTDPSFNDPSFNKGILPTYNRSAGGIHPQGWECDHLPYYVEWDTSIGYVAPYLAPVQWGFVYGMDDRAWLLSLSETDRNYWIRYAYDRVKCLDKNAFLLMPGLFRNHRYDPAFRTMNPTGAPFQSEFLYIGNGKTDPSRPSLSEYDVTGTINALWNGTPRTIDDNRFYKANTKDGTLYPTFSSSDKIYVGDFNSDGKSDVLVTDNATPASASSGSNWQGSKVYESTGDDFKKVNTIGYWHPCNGVQTYPSWGERIYVGDFDNDGYKNDLAITANKGLGLTCPGGIQFLKVYKTVQNGTETYQFESLGSISSPGWGEELVVGDFNMDKRDDILAYSANPGNNWTGFSITSTPFTPLNTIPNNTQWLDTKKQTQTFTTVANNINCAGCASPSYTEKFLAGDFDGDGFRNEFCTMANKDLSASWQGLRIYEVRGITGALTVTFRSDVACTNAGCFPSWGEKLYVGNFNGNKLDVNGDKRDDIIVTANASLGINWQGYRVLVNTTAPNSTSYTFAKKGVSGCDNQCCFPSWGERFNVGDFNGDGAFDFVVTANKQLGIAWQGWSMYHSFFPKSTPDTNGFLRGLVNATMPSAQPSEITSNIGRMSEEAVMDFTVSPNPIHQTAILSVPAALLQQPAVVTLSTLLGKTVRQITLPASHSTQEVPLDLTGFASGVYLIQLDAKQASLHRRIVVQ